MDGFIYKLKIYGKFVEINHELYKIKFLPDNYLTKYVSNTFESFFNILWRKNSTNSSTILLINLIENYELSAFYVIIYKLIENYAKSKEENYIDDKKIYMKLFI